MNLRPIPGSVPVIQVMLVLIGLYQVFVGGLVLRNGMFQMESPDFPDFPAIVFLRAAFSLAYAVAAAVLFVLVFAGLPVARPGVVGVNVLFGAAATVLMVTTPVLGVSAVGVAAFAFLTAGLMFTPGARTYFTAGSPGPHGPRVDME
ncbi:hypothetical protein [Nocardiopsis sp. MG754419]|uniref:hypothetical protein n=1 Tax=Nocardiopsis sp. MG754419 TaxID=2259865 RepID=UPI001BA6DBF3|nr:hypothetical protein [Nocardiopsis sp. MG754419]MBR8741895.1 hypothetical protein [Nocardiopsis sp. MG754419]